MPILVGLAEAEAGRVQYRASAGVIAGLMLATMSRHRESPANAHETHAGVESCTAGRLGC